MSGSAIGLTLLTVLAIGPGGKGATASAQEMKALRVVSEETATGFKFPESAAYEPQAKVLYVSEFGSELKPAEKDGKVNRAGFPRRLHSLSDCLSSQAICHGLRSRSMAFRIVRSFRIAAMTATLPGRPAATRR